MSTSAETSTEIERSTSERVPDVDLPARPRARRNDDQELIEAQQRADALDPTVSPDPTVTSATQV